MRVLERDHVSAVVEHVHIVRLEEIPDGVEPAYGGDLVVSSPQQQLRYGRSAGPPVEGSRAATSSTASGEEPEPCSSTAGPRPSRTKRTRIPSVVVNDDVDRLAFNGTTIEAGTDSCRPAGTRARAEGTRQGRLSATAADPDVSDEGVEGHRNEGRC